MSFVFISSPLGTFTPTQSGAIATVIWQCCQQAAKESIEPVVIARACAAEPYPWRRTIFVEFPPDPKGKVPLALRRLERRLCGWTFLGQRTFAINVARAIRKNALADQPLVLNNDPELAVFLRREFPKSFIVHHFHNVLTCKPKARRRLGEVANLVTAVSNFTSRWTEGYYGLRSGSVRTVYNGVDAEAFHPAPQPPPGPVTLTYLGRTGIEKGPDVFLRAALRLAERTTDFRVTMIGSNYWDRFELDDYQRQLRAAIDELTQRGIAVKCSGHVARAGVPGELRKSSIHVVPTRCDESFGLSTVEAMACGLAVVASSTGGSPEVLGDAGLLFARESVAELADHLYDLVSQPSLRTHYGRVARERALNFQWSHTWKRWKELLPI